MAAGVDYNKKGALLEELAGMQEDSECKTRLFEVIEGIRKIVLGLYNGDIQSVEKLEYRLANYGSFDQQSLELISRGVKEELTQGLDDHPEYDKDTVNQVFMALYGHLAKEIDSRSLDGIVDHDRLDDLNAELADMIAQINIYHMLTSWVTHNGRYVDGLDQEENSVATRKFRELKKSAVGFIGSFKTLAMQDNNIKSAYSSFTASKNWENYESARKVVEATMSDCKKIVADNNSQVKGDHWRILQNFAEIIELNSGYYFVQMGYEMFQDKDARRTIPNPEQFRSDLIAAANNPPKKRYLFVLKQYEATDHLDVKRITPEVMEFYQPVK